MNLNNIYLKYLKESHTFLGIFAIIFFYISTFFGTITVFKPYINNWESASKHFEIKQNSTINLDESIKTGLKELNNPTNKISITLPSFKDPSLSMKFGFSENIYINPYTAQLLDTKKETSFLSNFFNQMHINVNMSRTGQILMGIASLAIIFLSISGVYLWLINRKKRSQIKSFWLRWHKDISLIMLPYIIVFALSGAVLGVMLLSSSPYVYSATEAKETNLSKVVRPIIFPLPIKVRAKAEEAKMLSYSQLHQKAKENFKDLHTTNIMLFNWNDKNARIVFTGYQKGHSITTARVSRASIVLNGETGEIVTKRTVEDMHPVSKFMSSFYFFHFITDEGILVRIIYLILGIAFGLCLVFGLFFWINKKRSKYNGNENYYNFLSKFCIAFTIGLIPASSFLMFLYWLIPIYTIDRETWILGGFYALWSFTFFYCVYKKDSLEAIKLFMYLNSIFLILAVFLHGFRTNTFIWDGFNNMNSIFWMDTSLLIFAMGSYIFAKNINKITFLNKLKAM